VKKKRLMIWWGLIGKIAIEKIKPIKVIWIYFIFVVIRIDYSK